MIFFSIFNSNKNVSPFEKGCKIISFSCSALSSPLPTLLSCLTACSDCIILWVVWAGTKNCAAATAFCCGLFTFPTIWIYLPAIHSHWFRSGTYIKTICLSLPPSFSPCLYRYVHDWKCLTIKENPRLAFGRVSASFQLYREYNFLICGREKERERNSRESSGGRGCGCLSFLLKFCENDKTLHPVAAFVARICLNLLHFRQLDKVFN